MSKQNLDLLENIFYVHNLGRFDSVFILKSLILNEKIKLTPIWKDTALLSLIINYDDFKLTLLDSLFLIPESLDKVLKSFNCITQKGKFPYNFVNKNNLFYIGDKPTKEFYNNISDQDYNTILDQNWNLEQETLKYLKSDVEGLLEVVIKFSKYIFNKYQLNITRFKTLPGLALSAYTSSYMPNNLNLEFKVIKGELERELRSSYFGGNVEVFVNEITSGYLYDIN